MIQRYDYGAEIVFSSVNGALVYYKDHLAEVSKMAKEIEELKEAQRWRDVKEELPDIGYHILGITPSSVHSTLCYFDGELWRDVANDFNHINVTHWMPLPARGQG